MSDWMTWVALLALASGVISAVLLALDLTNRPQKMAVMNLVWPITGLYMGPLALWAYWTMGRAPWKPHHQPAMAMQGGGGGMVMARPFWQRVFLSSTHCGAGCVLGDIVGEWLVFAFALTIAGSGLWADFALDFALAYVVGIAFQYFAIVPKRHLRPREGVTEAIKADTLSLVAFEVGMFAWMAIVRLALHLQFLPNEPVYWFSTQIGMLIGFATTFPMNWLLVKMGVKEGM